MSSDMYEAQMALEELSANAGATQFQAQLQTKIQGKKEASTHYGAALLKRSITPMIEALEAFMADAKSGRPGRRHAAVKLLDGVDLKVAAYITARTTLDNLNATTAAATIAITIAGEVEDELRFLDFRKQEPGLWNIMQRQTSTSGSRHKRTVLRHTYEKHVDHWEGWTPTERLHLGMKLLETFTTVTGFVELKLLRLAAKRTKLVVFPTPKVKDWIRNSMQPAAQLHPRDLPMVVPPEPWSGPHGGGYLSIRARPIPFVKNASRAYLAELAEMDEQMAPVYEAVNAIQNVPWQINTRVLDVLTHLWDRGGAIAGLPPLEDGVVPPSPVEGIAKEDFTPEQQEAFVAWKRVATKIHTHNSRIGARRIAVSRVLSTALRMAPFERIYFPMNLDFRGRAYAIPAFLTPQGTDQAKGILQYHEAKPIGDGTGPGWLAIHGANCFGVDDISLEDRIQWVEDNDERILACAADPLSNMWWSEADKGDGAWTFLAFCFEWAGFREQGAAFMTRLPIALDASCSGLQHFSAAMRDPVCAASVNLTPSEEPHDVYTEVSDVVEREVRLDLDQGKEVKLAGRCLDFGIGRGTAKRPTMTLVYGATKFSCSSFVMDWVTDVVDKDPSKTELDGIEWDASKYLAGHVWSGIEEVVVAARVAMDWLREVSQEASRQGHALHWTTADGFPITQDYRDVSSRRIKTLFGDRFIFATLNTPKDNIDKRRQKNGLPPNWTHGQDGTHLRMTVLAAKDNGISNFAVIHDSFGTHAPDTDMLRACLRTTFADLYEDDHLGRFAAEIKSQLPDQTKFPEPPELGDFDVSLIKDSEYAFS